MISVRGLSRRYGTRLAVDGLEFDVNRGEAFGFLGPNGAGKTTTIRMLLGLVRPTTGEVRLFGESCATNPRVLLRRIGAMVEAPAFYPYMSGADNLRLLAMADGVPFRLVEQTLDRMGLREAGERKFSAYSVGMKQRLALAAVLLRDPELVILDEPTTGLDPQGQQRMLALVREMTEAGTTVFFSSHALHEVEAVCHRVAVLVHGRLTALSTISALTSGSTVIEVRVAEPDRAMELLSSVEWVTGVECLGDRLTVCAPPERSSEVNRILASEGIFAAEIRVAKRTLESVYLELTNGQEAA